MHVLPYFPPDIAGPEYEHRLGLIKRQLLVLLKVNHGQFAACSADLTMFFQTYFFFKPADDELLSLVVRVLKRFLHAGHSIDFSVFLDCVDCVPPSDANFVAGYLKSIPEDFHSISKDKFTRAVDAMRSTVKRDPKPVDETIALLDDKSFVTEFKQSFIDCQYEDEYVDNDDFPEDCVSTAAVPFATFSDSDVTLFEAFMKNPAVLTKSGRSHPERAPLCSRLKWSHEQVEGWATMLARNRDRDKILTRFAQWKADAKRW